MTEEYSEDTVESEEFNEPVEQQEETVSDDSVSSDEVASHQQEQQPTDKEMNFARLREKSERAEDRARELEARLARLEAGNQNQQQQKEVKAKPSLNFDDAIDSEHLQQVKSYVDDMKGDYERKLEDLSLRSIDNNYIQTINNYLPAVLDEDPDLRDIIKDAPESKKLRLMLKFAKTNAKFGLDKSVSQDSAVPQGQVPEVTRTEKNLMRNRTMGSVATQAVNKVSANDVWDMDNEQFSKYFEKLTKG